MALYTILQNDRAQIRLELLLTDKNVPRAGKLYALVGLRWLDRAAFDKAVIPFLTNQTQIVTGFADVLSMRSVASVARRIQQDKIILSHPVDYQPLRGLSDPFLVEAYKKQGPPFYPRPAQAKSGNQETGRAVTMDLDGTHKRVQHKDFLLSHCTRL